MVRLFSYIMVAREVGSRKNLFQISPDEIRAARVLLTFVDGQVVYKASGKAGMDVE